MSDCLVSFQTNNSYNQPKVVETYNNMIILNNVYQKSDMSFIDRCNLMFNIDTGTNTLNIAKYMILDDAYTDTYQYGDRDKFFTPTEDKYVSNRCYFIINNHRSNRNRLYSYLISYDENENNIVINKISTLKNVEWQQIVDQDTNFLYVMGMSYPEDPNAGTWNPHERLYKVNKSTLEATVIIDTTNTKQFSVLYTNEGFIYIIIFYPKIPSSERYGYYICKYDKSAGTSNVIQQTPVDNGWAYNPRIENFYIENDKYYWIAPLVINNTGFVRLYYDENDNQIYHLEDDILINDISFSAFTDNTSASAVSANGYIIFKQWIVDNYLYYITYDETKKSSNILANQGLYVFKINPGFELEYITKEEISNDTRIISTTLTSDNKILLIGYTNSFEIYVHNNETGLYESNETKLTNILTAGFDSNDNLWYMKTDFSIYMEYLKDPFIVDVKFEKIHYAYNNSNIESYIKFKAESYIKIIPPSGTYIFILSGPAHFKDNNEQIINIEYIEGEITIPIVITGSKKVNCKVRFVK